MCLQNPETEEKAPRWIPAQGELVPRVLGAVPDLGDLGGTVLQPSGPAACTGRHWEQTGLGGLPGTARRCVDRSEAQAEQLGPGSALAPVGEREGPIQPRGLQAGDRVQRDRGRLSPDPRGLGPGEPLWVVLLAWGDQRRDRTGAGIQRLWWRELCH